MATIRRRGDRYHVQIRRKGFAPVTRSFDSRKDALEWARKIEGQIDRHDLEPNRKVLRDISLRDIIIRYCDEIVPMKRGGEVEAIVLKAFLRHPICLKALSHLCAEDFASYRDERLRVVSASTLKRQLNPVRSALNIARKECDSH